MRSEDETRFQLELLKLLLQAACADDQVVRVEAEIVLGLARSWALPEQEIAPLRAAIEQGRGLPAPDLGLLRRRPREVLTAIEVLIRADGRLSGSEAQLLAQVETLL